jgi:FkbM family methyltransferase
MFDDCNPFTNGEIMFFESIKDKCKIIFDVGASDDSYFINVPCEVHYFEPLPRNIENLKIKENKNTKSFFNNFGLSDKQETLKYYDNHGSFINREIGYSRTPSHYSGIDLLVKRCDGYIIENKIEQIDFMKIDVEGYEINVLRGLGEQLKNIKHIQFEYGSAVADGNYKMIDIVELLKTFNFGNFSYLSNRGLVPINNFSDHWRHCNIICDNLN